MATIIEPKAEGFKTGQEHLNDLTNIELSSSVGGSPEPASSPSEITSTSTSPSQAPPPLDPGGGGPSISSAPREAPQALSFDSYTPNPNISGNLFEGITSGLRDQSDTLRRAAEAFNLDSGARRTYEGIEGQRTLEEALRGDLSPEERSGRVGAAKDLASATYRGPTNLEGAIPDQDDIAGVSTSLQDLYSRAQALGTHGGLQTILKETNPGLTPGQLSFEATRLRGDPSFRQSVGAAQGDVSGLLGLLAGGQREAEALATARGAEESDIASKAQEFLAGRKGGVLGDIDQGVATETAAQEAAEDAVTRWAETGDLSDLAAVSPEVLGGLDPSVFSTDAQKILQEGIAERDRIMNQFGEISEVPMLVPGINSHGRRRFEIPDEWWRENKGSKSPGELQRIKDLSLERHRALTEAGFSPSAENYQVPGTSIQTDDPGKFGNVMPLYFNEEIGNFEPLDARNYAAEWDPGVSPSRENISTEEQKRIINTINEILDIKDQDLQNPEEAFRRARLVMDAQKYLDDEKAILDERRQYLTESQEEWDGQINAARKRYKKTQKKKKFTKIARTINTALAGVGTLGLGSAIYGGAREEGPISGLLKGVEEKEGDLAYTLSPK